MKKFLLWVSMISVFTATMQPLMAMEDSDVVETKETWEMSHSELKDYYDEVAESEKEANDVFEEYLEYYYIDAATGAVGIIPSAVGENESMEYSLDDKQSMLRGEQIHLSDILSYDLSNETVASLREMDSFLNEIHEKIENGDITYDGTGYYATAIYEDYTIQSAKNSFSIRTYIQKLPIFEIVWVRVKKYLPKVPIPHLVGYKNIHIPNGYKFEFKKSTGLIIGGTSLALQKGSAAMLNADPEFISMKKSKSQLVQYSQTLESISEKISKNNIKASAFMSFVNGGSNDSSHYFTEDEISFIRLLAGAGFNFNTFILYGNVDTISELSSTINDVSAFLNMVSVALSVTSALNVISSFGGPAVLLIAKTVFALATNLFYNLIGSTILFSSMSCYANGFSNEHIAAFLKLGLMLKKGTQYAPVGCSGTRLTSNLILGGVQYSYVV